MRLKDNTTLYIGFYEDLYEATVFFYGDGTPFHAVNDNDGNWRHEYFDPVLNRYGITVKHAPDKLHTKAKKFLEEEFGYEFE